MYDCAKELCYYKISISRLHNIEAIYIVGKLTKTIFAQTGIILFNHLLFGFLQRDPCSICVYCIILYIRRVPGDFIRLVDVYYKGFIQVVFCLFDGV